RHDDALSVFARLQEELPKLGQHPKFRKWVKLSEKKSQRKDTLLPKKKFSLKGLFSRSNRDVPTAKVTWKSLMVLGILLGLVLLGFVISNEYIRKHRTLYIVNGYPEMAAVRIVNGGERNRVRQTDEIVLSEGHYHVVITGPVQQETDF